MTFKVKWYVYNPKKSDLIKKTVRVMDWFFFRYFYKGLRSFNRLAVIGLIYGFVPQMWYLNVSLTIPAKGQVTLVLYIVPKFGTPGQKLGTQS